MKAIPHKVVGAGVVVNRKGEILLAQRHERDMLGGLWEFPGGTREKGESIRQCIARELTEELGIHVAVGPLVLKVSHTYSHFTMDLHAHWARIRKGRPRPLECAGLVWARVDDLRAYPMSRADIKVLEEVERTECPI